jgi:hypothetical protein
LDAQPAAFTDSVSRNGFVSGMAGIVNGLEEFAGQAARRFTLAVATIRARSNSSALATA